MNLKFFTINAFSIPRLATALLALAILVGGFTSPATAQSNGTIWFDDFEKAKQVAAKENKVVMLHFWATWCTPCKNLDKFVFSNPGVARAISENVIAVKVNVDHRPDLARKYQVASIPADIVIDSNGTQLGKRSSPNTADAYTKMVRGFAKMKGTDIEAITKINQQRSELAETKEATGVIGGGSFQATNDTSNSMSSGNSTEPDLFDGSIVANAQAKLAEKLTQQANDKIQTANGELGTATQRVNAELARGQAALLESANRSTAKINNTIGSTFDKAKQKVDPYLNETEKTMADIANAVAEEKIKRRVAIDGFCPVTLINQESWTKGDVRWGCVHRGKTYLFTSKENRDLFRMAPDAYSPLLAGYDPVFFKEDGDLVDGKRKHGAFFGGDEGPKIVVLFDSSETRAKFEANPSEYIQTVRSAMNQTDRDTIYR